MSSLRERDGVHRASSRAEPTELSTRRVPDDDGAVHAPGEEAAVPGVRETEAAARQEIEAEVLLLGARRDVPHGDVGLRPTDGELRAIGGERDRHHVGVRDLVSPVEAAALQVPHVHRWAISARREPAAVRGHGEARDRRRALGERRERSHLGHRPPENRAVLPADGEPARVGRERQGEGVREDRRIALGDAVDLERRARPHHDLLGRTGREPPAVRRVRHGRHRIRAVAERRELLARPDRPDPDRAVAAPGRDSLPVRCVGHVRDRARVPEARRSEPLQRAGGQGITRVRKRLHARAVARERRAQQEEAHPGEHTLCHAIIVRERPTAMRRPG